MTTILKKNISLHRLILNLPKGYQVDHKNMDKLDNRKENLRFCTHQENMVNRGKQKNNTSGYKGVIRRKNFWVARIGYNNRTFELGAFKIKRHAALVYDMWALELFKGFAQTNFIIAHHN